MKRIVCIGSLSTEARDLPSAPIMGLYNELRNFNTKYSVKGIFLVSRINLMLILEGDYNRLAEIQYKLRRDERLCNISIVANHELDKSYFDKWLIRFLRLDSPSHVQSMQRLKNQIGQHIETENKREQQILSTFLFEHFDDVNASDETLEVNDVELDYPTNNEESRFENTLLSLTVWPKASQVKLSPSVIKTCSMLSIRKVSYDVLKHTDLWSDEDELNTFLTQLEQLGALEVIHITPQTQGIATNASEPLTERSNRDRFSQLLRKLINTPKTKVS